MGCVSSGQSDDMEDIDREVLANFLQNRENLKTIWKQFNKNEEDVLDRSDFDHLLFCALQIFCKERDPNLPSPTRATLDPFVAKLRSELAPRIDRDGDGVISFDEFKSFGEYLKQEYRKLKTQNSNRIAENNIANTTAVTHITTTTNPSGLISDAVAGSNTGITNNGANMDRNDNIVPAAFQNTNFVQ